MRLLREYAFHIFIAVRLDPLAYSNGFQWKYIFHLIFNQVENNIENWFEFP